MIERLYEEARVLFPPTNDDGMTEVAIGGSLDADGLILLQQENRHIVLDAATVPELCKMLRELAVASKEMAP